MNQGIAPFAPSGKSGKSKGFALFAPSGKNMKFVLFAPSGKSMNHEICAFCTKWPKYESWDLHFLHQVAKYEL